jgi:hypothetical protein
VRDDEGHTLLTYRSFASVVGIVAALVAGIVLAAGGAAAAFLAFERHPLSAIGALMLSLLFALVIAILVPPTNVTIFNGQTPVLTIVQRSRVNFPHTTFAVRDGEGGTVAVLRKNAFARLGRNRWHLSDAKDYPIGEAFEESLGGALIRKFAGKFSRRYETDVVIRTHEKVSGRIIRRANGAAAAVDILELEESAIDPRIAIAVATLVLGSEP